MVIRSKENSIGAWAFLIGVILAVVIGVSASFVSIPVIAKYNAQVYAVLVVLGLIVGSMNVTSKDSTTFMLASAILVIVSKFGMEGVTGSLIGIEIGQIVTSIFGALLALFVPATIIVALKAVFSIAKV